MFHAARTIYMTDGIKGFYRGLVPSCIGVAPQLGLQFGFYALLQNMWNTAFDLAKDHHPSNFLENQHICTIICSMEVNLFSQLKS